MIEIQRISGWRFILPVRICKIKTALRPDNTSLLEWYSTYEHNSGIMLSKGNDEVPRTMKFLRVGGGSVQDKHKSELAQQFIEAVDYLNRQMHACGLDEWDGLDMTMPQIKTLVLLERSGPLRMGNIATYLGRALSATTTVIDRLVEKGLVDRAWDPSDRRVVICRLTDKGQCATGQFWKIRRERLHLMTDILDVEQLEIVVQGLELMRAADRQMREISAP